VRALLKAIGIAAVLAFAAAAPAAAKIKTTEHPIDSRADSGNVLESLVRVEDPLPEELGAPRACDFIEYLRFRHANGPSKARRADAVMVIIPGFLGGATNFDQLARNTVETAAKKGKHVEYWALDRRSNCLEDDRGIRAAVRAEDYSKAYGYYWGGEPVRGKTFEGFKTETEAGFLSSFGLERTLRDWYTVLRSGIRGQRRRERKVVCGGHSLGGPLTAAFSSWDFDGDPETTKDAGYSQCAGLVGLDTTLELSGSSSGASALGPLLDLVSQGGAAPFINVPPLTPETIQVPTVFGVGAYFDPGGTGMTAELPHTTNIDIAQRALFSRDAIHFATGMPDIREFTLTNELTLGGVFDDNSAPLSFLRSSVGFLEGGPVFDKNFPSPDGTLALVEDPADSVTYEWQSYDDVGPPDNPLELNDGGEPYTSRESEVTDIRELARIQWEAPANFTEQYFPVKIVTDVAAAESGAFEELLYEGPTLKPAILIQAGDSDSNDPTDDEGKPLTGTPPNDFALSAEKIIPGYNHLDVATAAADQNDGRAEPSSKILTRFALAVVRGAG
jgi:hypothetical protein